ncbi:MAG TPA: hypothetical protein VGL61_15885 [Kofleriaceae bacterium]
MAVTEPLTWSEICARFPDEWVALVDVDWVNDRDFEFRSARVVGHGKRRRDPLDQARAFRDTYPCLGHFFTGRVSAPTAPLLFT